ncbi:alanine racemase [Marinicauda algicola]|uniref:Alanine racemase n=2 Tax=Marinicauda algicola TaxID=2029849 RepID=A0A4V3RYC2_9PROT|nr:alanine racemase [Marinicauda algicola]
MASPVPRLVVDLDALARNYAALKDMAGPAAIGAVVKADAYGLGAGPVARRLAREGCRSFFVATALEGRELRRALGSTEAEIFVFHGFWPGEAGLLKREGLVPVINTLDQLDAFEAEGGGPLALHFDTGMNRLGLSREETEALLADPARLDRLDITLALSHLASSEDARSQKNSDQLARFRAIAAALSGRRLSLANTGGVLLGRDYHFDLVRPGIGLYGLHPAGTDGGPFEPVASIEAPVLQLRTMAPGETIGYGATYTARTPRRTATVALGYADGLMRAVGNGGSARIGDETAPLLGRVSMDLAAIDVTDLQTPLRPGDRVRFLGHDLAQSARTAGTIGYELLVRLGSRLERVYVSAS